MRPGIPDQLDESSDAAQQRTSVDVDDLRCAVPDDPGTRQEGAGGDLGEAVGYALRQTTLALRIAMNAVLRPLNLTVPQYACLQLVHQHPGQSNAALARDVVVSPQSLNQVLLGLQRRGLVTRPPAATHGRNLPATLTTTGRQQLQTAHTAIRRIEQQMLAPLPRAHQQQLCEDLAACTTALTSAPEYAPSRYPGSGWRGR